LHHASDSGHLEVAQLLLDRGADPNSLNSNNESPLHLASLRGHQDVAQLLIERGAEANSPDNHNRDPLQLATQGGDSDVTNVVLHAEQRPARYKALKWSRCMLM
jgi:ankyrin repeat protein